MLKYVGSAVGRMCELISVGDFARSQLISSGAGNGYKNLVLFPFYLVPKHKAVPFRSTSLSKKKTNPIQDYLDSTLFTTNAPPLYTNRLLKLPHIDYIHTANTFACYSLAILS